MHRRSRLSATLTFVVLGISGLVGCASHPAKPVSAPTAGVSRATTTTSAPVAQVSHPAKPAVAPLAKVSQLRNAPIPASCMHKAATLRGYQRTWGDPANMAELVTKSAVFTDVSGNGSDDAVVPLECTSGNAPWPEVLLAYGPGRRGPRLLGSWDMHTLGFSGGEFTSMRPREHSVAVSFRAYNGVGFDMTTYRGAMTVRGGRVVFTHTPPLTIDYTSYLQGQLPTVNGMNGRVASPTDAAAALAPAPAGFQQFIVDQWMSLNQHYCPTAVGGRHTASQPIDVMRYSHLGFALATEVGCTWNRVLYAKVGGTWEPILTYGDGPACWGSQSSPAEIRALTVLGQSCYMNSGSEHMTALGQWPRSGQ